MIYLDDGVHAPVDERADREQAAPVEPFAVSAHAIVVERSAEPGASPPHIGDQV
jgi:threonine dehydrogenase-like Zn-dependent dehydrogenase